VDDTKAVAVTLSATRSFVRFNGRIASMYPFEFTDSLRYPESYDREHTLSSKLARMLLDGRRWDHRVFPWRDPCFRTW